MPQLRQNSLAPLQLSIKSKKGSDWLTPSSLMIIILVILLGMTFLFLAYKLRGTFLS